MFEILPIFVAVNAKSGASKQAVGGKNGGKRFSAHQFFERKTLENRRQDPLSPPQRASVPVNSSLTTSSGFQSVPACGMLPAGNSEKGPPTPTVERRTQPELTAFDAELKHLPPP